MRPWDAAARACRSPTQTSATSMCSSPMSPRRASAIVCCRDFSYPSITAAGKWDCGATRGRRCECRYNRAGHSPSMLLHVIALLATMSRTNPYPRLAPARRDDRILIVAPHVDDEAIAAGGYVFDAIANGAEVYVVYLTAGDCARFSARLMHKTLEPTASNYLSVGRTPIAEAHAAMKLLGVPADHLFVLGYPDRGLRAMVDNPDAIVRSSGTRAHEVPYDDALSPGSQYKIENAISDLKQVIELTRPTTVVA